jgi:LysM repeat protein
MGRVLVTVVAAAVLVAGTAIVVRYMYPGDGALAGKAPAGAPTATPAGQAQTGAVAVASATNPKAAGVGAGAAGAPVAPPAPAGPGEAAADDGMALVNSGRLFQAEVRLSEALRAGVDGAKGKAVREALNLLADRTQLSGQRLPDDPYSKTYQVARGDSVTTIGGRFLIPLELVMKLNRMGSPDIAAGQSLKVIQGPVTVEVFKKRFEIQAWLGDVCLRVYPVAIGKNDATPEGTFTVKIKLRNPPYQPQHKAKSEFRDGGAPDNPLGARWIDIGNHYGIHGTIDPTSIGKEASEGCIRMNNKDVEELFDMVVPGATKVMIRP